MSKQDNDNDGRKVSSDTPASRDHVDATASTDTTTSRGTSASNSPGTSTERVIYTSRSSATKDNAEAENTAAAGSNARTGTLAGGAGAAAGAGAAGTGHTSGADATDGAHVSSSGRPFEPGDMRPEHRPRSNGGGGRSKLIPILFVLLLLAIAAMVLGGYFFKQQRDDMAQLRESVEQAQQNSHQASQQISGELNSRDQRISSLQSKLEENDRTLQRVLEELTRSQQTDERQWQNAEIEYLLRMANQRLQLERDVSGARSLLQTADQRLERIDNPAQLPVRRAIASELSRLDSMPDVDRNGLFLTLASLADRVDQLPLSQESKALSAQQDDGSLFSGGWREQLSRLGGQLKDLVTVRRHDEPLEALVTPAQEGYLRQNVRLLIEQAQLGLLRSNSEIYRTSLERASELVTTYFRTEDDNVRSVLDQLNQLGQRNISPELPDISGSINALERLQEARRNGQNGLNVRGGQNTQSSQNAQGGQSAQGSQNAQGAQNAQGGQSSQGASL